MYIYQLEFAHFWFMDQNSYARDMLYIIFIMEKTRKRKLTVLGLRAQVLAGFDRSVITSGRR